MHLTATLKLKKLKEREALLKSEIDTLNTNLKHETATLITDLLDHYDLLTLPQNSLLGVLDETLDSLTTTPSLHSKYDAHGQKVRQKLKQSRSNFRGKRSLKEGDKGDKTAHTYPSKKDEKTFGIDPEKGSKPKTSLPHEMKNTNKISPQTHA